VTAVAAAPSRGQALLAAAVVLWAPVATPLLVLGDWHGGAAYFHWLPIVPAVLAPALLHLDGVWFAVAGGIGTLLLFVMLFACERDLPLGLRWLVRAVAMLAVAAEAVGFAAALRA
jgi:hypothetical protein